MAVVDSSNSNPNQELNFRREVRREDAAAVRNIVESTGYFSPDEVEVAVELVDDRLSRGAASGYEFLFATLGDQVAGYSCFGKIACTDSCYDLYWIAVRGDLRGRGIGRVLLEESERAIKDCGARRVYVETAGRAHYDSTRAFYRNCGYRQEAVLKDFYSPGDAKVIFVKDV